MHAAVRRDRAIIVSGLAVIVVLGWTYLVVLARGMRMMDMAMPQMQPWGARDVVLTFIMWAVMMAAMMVPSASPMVLMVGATERRRQGGRPYLITGLFVLGYLAVWTLFSALAVGAQWALHGAALLSPKMASTSPLLGGSLLLAAGIFQWTSLKHACLTHCRTPLGFVATEWREGALGAFRMGLKHGSFCVACCWFLMALLFVAGVMNLAWVAAIAVFVLLEKIVPTGRWLARVAGLVLAGSGLWMAIPPLVGG